LSFALVSTFFAKQWMSWESTAKNLGYTLVIVPVTWHLLSGRRHPIGLSRAAFTGGICGLVSQLAMHAPHIWALAWVNLSGRVKGEDLAAGIETLIYVWIGVCSTVLGATLGLLIGVVERRTHASRR